jgi:formylglycine-generating enzyme required for sulfatase activity
VRTSVAAGDATRVALALSRQLEGPERVARKSVTSQQQWFEPEMVLVKGGTFTMGCVPARDGTCKSNELPARQVQLSSFYIGKYEMTTAQWNAVMKGHPLEKINPTEDQGPVSGIAWVHLDTAFLLRLNALTGRTTAATKYRLPTAAEWEYAARGCSGDGGTGVATCESFMYSGSNTVNDVAWTSSGRPVGQKKPNGLGIYDMSGNNWEWCNDLFSATYYSTLPESGVAVNPTGVTTGTTLRTQRGGGWYPTDNTTHRVAARQAACTANCYDGTTGFRLVLPAQ